MPALLGVHPRAPSWDPFVKNRGTASVTFALAPFVGRSATMATDPAAWRCLCCDHMNPASAECCKGVDGRGVICKSARRSGLPTAGLTQRRARPENMSADNPDAHERPALRGETTSFDVQQNEALVGRHIRVWWEGDQAWFNGFVRSYSSHRGHCIEYDDGEVKYHVLDEGERWEPLSGDAKRVTVAGNQASPRDDVSEAITNDASQPAASHNQATTAMLAQITHMRAESRAPASWLNIQESPRAFVASSDCGLGLYARIQLEPAEEICEYAGPVLPLRVLQKGEYVLRVPGTLFGVDGNCDNSPFETPRHAAIYANHSEHPNARLECKEVMKGTSELCFAMLIIAVEAIDAGQEIRIDYEGGEHDEYWMGAPPPETDWRLTRLPVPAHVSCLPQPMPWRKGGDARLLELVTLLVPSSSLTRPGAAWGRVATHMPGRSGADCWSRWQDLRSKQVAVSRGCAEQDSGSPEEELRGHHLSCTSSSVASSQDDAKRQALAEGLILMRSDRPSHHGYLCVSRDSTHIGRPYSTVVRRNGRQVSIGRFTTAEEASLCFARSPEGKDAALKFAASKPMTAADAIRQAAKERLTLLTTSNPTGFTNVYDTACDKWPYQVCVHRSGKCVTLGRFATAEEAALCFARSEEGKVAAAKAAEKTLTPEDVIEIAKAEGLTLLTSEANATGFLHVTKQNDRGNHPFQVIVIRDGGDSSRRSELGKDSSRRKGRIVSLGYFATAEEAALCFARSPEGKAAAAARQRDKLAAATEAKRLAKEEGLTLVRADNASGYAGVTSSFCKTTITPRFGTTPFKAEVSRNGKRVLLGKFATAEEAALCYARTPEGRAAAAKPLPLTADEARQQAHAEGLELLTSDYGQNQSGFQNVMFNWHKSSYQYTASVSREGQQTVLGHFQTAEEAALCFARSPEGRIAAEKASFDPVAAADEARRQAAAEGLELITKNNRTGFKGVTLLSGFFRNGRTPDVSAKRFAVMIYLEGKDTYLDAFATAEEAALCYARAAAERMRKAHTVGLRPKKRVNGNVHFVSRKKRR